TVQIYYAHTDAVPAAAIESAYRDYLDKIVRTDDRREFDLATLRFIATLKNGHTHFYDSWLAANHGRPLPFWLAPPAGRWVVAWSADARLHKGDVVRAIDGSDIERFVQTQADYIGASSPRIARRWAFSTPFLFPQRFTLTLENGREIQIERGSKRPAETAQ